MNLGIAMVHQLCGACAKLLPKSKTGWVGNEGGRTHTVESRMFSLVYCHSEKSNSFACGLQTEGRIL